MTFGKRTQISEEDVKLESRCGGADGMHFY
jgi:hypothetical protein